MANAELVVEVCVCEWSPSLGDLPWRSLVFLSGQQFKMTFFHSTWGICRYFLFLLTPFEKLPKLAHISFQKNLVRNHFIINCWKIMVTSLEYSPWNGNILINHKLQKSRPANVLCNLTTSGSSLVSPKGRLLCHSRFFSKLLLKLCRDGIPAPQLAFTSSGLKACSNILRYLLSSIIRNLRVENSVNKRNFLWEMGGFLTS